ncbi:MAG: integrase, partial [Xanthobacteraceae bacterium]
AIADYPELATELAKVPAEQRIGPIIINTRTGVPPTEAQCRRAFRRIARVVGIPDNIWNMDARAGADTEAYEAGATEEETMALLTHTERKTSRRYLRDLTEQSRRAAAKRVGARKE